MNKFFTIVMVILLVGCNVQKEEQEVIEKNENVNGCYLDVNYMNKLYDSMYDESLSEQERNIKKNDLELKLLAYAKCLEKRDELITECRLSLSKYKGLSKDLASKLDEDRENAIYESSLKITEYLIDKCKWENGN